MTCTCYKCFSKIILPIRLVKTFDTPIMCGACTMEKAHRDEIRNRTYRSRNRFYYDDGLRSLIEAEEERKFKYMAIRIKEYYSGKND